MPSFDSQNTDRENSKPVPKSTRRDDDVKTLAQSSAQAIANSEQRDTTNGVREGGQNPGATIK